MRPGVPGSDCGTGVAAAPDFGAPSGSRDRPDPRPQYRGGEPSRLLSLSSPAWHPAPVPPIDRSATLWGVTPAPLPEGQQAGGARSEPSTLWLRDWATLRLSRGGTVPPSRGARPGGVAGSEDEPCVPREPCLVSASFLRGEHTPKEAK